jgi:hypothetical protein
MRYLGIAIALLVALQPAIASADRGGGGRGGGMSRGGGGGMSRGGGGARPSGGFNLSRDTARPPQNRAPVSNGNRNNGNRNNGNLNNGNKNNNNNGNKNNNNNGNKNNNNNGNKNNNNNGNNYYNNSTHNNVNVSGNTVIRNPVYVNNSAWGWNHGVAWYPAGNYWGGGFWGAFAIGVTSAAVGAAVYGSIVSNNVTYTSYQVAPSSPGATFLSNYQLTQVQCGPPGLVVVYGPSNSVICANPNHLVSAGYYELDTQTLSITSIQS